MGEVWDPVGRQLFKLLNWIGKWQQIKLLMGNEIHSKKIGRFTSHISVTGCSKLTAPNNGAKSTDETGDGSIVEFTCDQGYTLIGDSSIMCSDGNWSGNVPVCAGTVIVKNFFVVKKEYGCRIAQCV